MLQALKQPIFTVSPHLTWLALIDILLVAFLIYQLLMIVRGRRAAHVLTGVVVLVVIYFAAQFLGFELLRLLLATLAPYAPFALIVMFQSEIRRWLSRIGRRQLFSFRSPLQQRELFEDVVLALRQLSQTRTGALIVLERDVGLRTFVESGVALDATPSRELLLTIFQNGSALHDGAVIIRNGKIAAAGCFLPLSTRPSLSSKLGTRHRAAIGVTEETDCLALIVSEETGRISVAAFGEIEFDVSSERLRERMLRHLQQKVDAPAEHPIAIATTETFVRAQTSDGAD